MDPIVQHGNVFWGVKGEGSVCVCVCVSVSEKKEELTLHSLLGTNLNQLRPTKRDPADIGEDIIGNNQAHRQEEPDHAFEDVVHDEVGLDDDEVKRHMSPGELGELEAVVALLEGADEEDEAWLRKQEVSKKKGGNQADHLVRFSRSLSLL